MSYSTIACVFGANSKSPKLRINPSPTHQKPNLLHRRRLFIQNRHKLTLVHYGNAIAILNPPPPLFVGVVVDWLQAFSST
ncbi:hypothetical protein H6G36_23460 [Anabaena minutissima FACHB-250]|nr:hypothetical protein [Anabaena minutissima FACHB-250]